MKIIELTNTDFAMRHFLAPLLREGRARGHEMVGACPDGPLLVPLRAEGFRITPLPLKRSASPIAQLQGFAALVSLLRAEKPDLVHAHMPLSGFWGRMAARAAGVPHIAYTCHGFLFNQPSPWPRRAASFGMEWTAGKITDLYLTVSQEEARDARRLGIARKPIAIGNGRSPAIFHPNPVARARIRDGLGVPEDRVVIVIVSRLVRHKGHPELLAAMESVPNAELWVVGERLPSDHGEDLDTYFAQSRLGARLRRLGYREDTADVLAAADIFALPSHFEGLPMSVIEAMLTGLPVVATDIRGPREQVAEGETGFLVPPRETAPLAEALGKLVADPGLRASMGAAGLAYARDNFDETKIIGRTLDLLEATAG
ncbi:glycosyltransferase family 4 protein [Acidisoma cellulosilytica]|uniref:Glycosyltransferase family 4 protein n=1 Tax=Acidisoma cellulosilyticum TaxID=2802395 RepID=A0A963YXR4_9PROT|nr:glycosyltransferase family 4 protein [Acidisoma cellulosilyticum]MCB8879118.1 glycosyltransferase family 4 protein [Acidisoma cellulosilyticum]